MKTLILAAALVIVATGCNNKDSLHAGKDDACCKEKTTKIASAPPADLSKSLYQIEEPFHTQENQTIRLSMFEGKPTVVGMIFTHCGYACPRLTADMQQIEKQLGAGKDKVNFLLVSFDVARDVPTQLKAFATHHKLGTNWTLLHGNEEAVRTLSVLLNVQYEKDADGNFSHSNIISVLDDNGIIAHQQEGLEANHTTTMSVLKTLIQ